MAGIFTFLTIFFLFACCNLVYCDSGRNLKLKRVLILGRHNVRTPLTSNLERASSQSWPKWKEDVGHLTEKGSQLESYMGDYFSKWLYREELFDGCPEKNSIFIYANALPRTRDSAKEFVEAGFKNCNVTVRITPNVITDPVFHPVILNTTEAFKNIVINEMQKKLDDLHLQRAYSLLNEILEFNNSQICKDSGFCDLNEWKDEIKFKIGDEPDIEGPLNVGNAVVDAFLMSYYNGMRSEDIAWGKIRPESWELLTKITKENQNVRFNSTILARHVAKPLIQLLQQVITNDDLKFTLLVGHDSNINSIIASLGFYPFHLEENYERTPVGGKIVFQKWYDEDLDKYYLKINYVYQTTEQLRQATRLTLRNPPKSVILELQGCKTDENGFCPWKHFFSVLEAANN